MGGTRVAISKSSHPWIQDQVNRNNGVPQKNILLASSESGVQTTLKSNGDLQVNVRYVIDTNDKTEDGRIYLNDDYVLSAKGREVVSFSRSYAYNGKGKSAAWKKWLGQIKAHAKPNAAQAQELANKVVLKEALKAKLISLKRAGRPFFEASGAAAQKADSTLTLRFKEAESHVSIEKKGDRYYVKTHYVVDTDDKSDNGRVILEDTFKLDASTLKMTNYYRRWKVHPDSYGLTKATNWVDKLKKQPDPSFKAAEGFVKRVVVPVFFEKPAVPKASAVTTLPAKKPTPVKRVKLTSPKPKASAKPYVVTYSQSVKIKRNATEDNVGRLFRKAVQNVVTRDLAKTNITKFKIKISIHFDHKTGAIRRIEFRNPETTGGKLSDARMKALLRKMADRMRHNIRAHQKLSKNILNIPASIVLQ